MRRKIPSTTTLIAFDSAARHESFTKAAKELSLTQGAVCRQIGGLEEFLGVKLFRRTRRGVEITEAGRIYSRQIANQLDAMERDTLSLMAHQGRSRTIELAVMPTFAMCWLIPRLKSFYDANPEVRINLTTQTRPFLFDQTEFDAALYHGLAGWPGTEAFFLMREEAVPVCSPRLLAGRRNLTPEEIAAMPLLQQTTRPYAWRSWFASLGMSVAGSMGGMRLELFTMLAKAAAQDMGVALMPPMLIEAELASGQLVVAMNHCALSDSAYFLILPEAKVEDPTLLAFRDWLEKEAHGYTPPAVGLE
ncbi:LysR family transcriptional regulator protein [Azotobacter vinelandii CA]|uniref:HTH-type transcriptional regulator TrpI n=2 Tax=Azotobacter vinelandii TaxID=354 RepID=C1DIJ9_AZOVD|nr:LysR family transcriptional regulator [Azotobacter vinelandii]ACO78680.1 LysR family transcriptional regulator protein [Azotobacter vinelandii DJ]AGK14943.1 LysR family transcriptional regulator protein [Azotobacter vinelandii CA]AGK20653.1 LysR family transcriptional regulator protein [Azotobacter vinelandii CA6]WKN24336.1 LysR family transcriptional regulator [Azotobacter vinelandii]SFY05058.1 transcriptional regulator, LysR family [Azotobacter vinelandii]